MPILSIWFPGKELIPRSVVITGICAFSANCFNSSNAREMITPLPAMIRGRCAWLMKRAAFLI